MTTGSISYSLDAIIVKSNKASDIESAVLNVRTSLKTKSKDEIDTIMRVAHKLGDGKRERNKNDRFTKFWIALEALINLDGKRRDIADRIEAALVKLYKTNNPAENYKIKSGSAIRDIKIIRVDAFHYAIDNPEKANQTEHILEDLIRSEVGLVHRGYARQYLEIIP